MQHFARPVLLIAVLCSRVLASHAAEPTCVLAADLHGALTVYVGSGEQSFALEVSEGRATARVHDASEAGIPVDVASALRFSGHVYDVASTVARGGDDGELEIGVGARLEIEALRPTATGWLADVRYRDAVARGVPVRCEDLALGVDRQVALPGPKGARWWTSRAPRLELADPAGTRSVTLEFDPSPFEPEPGAAARYGELQEIGRRGSRVRVVARLGTNVYARGWVERAALAEHGGLTPLAAIDRGPAAPPLPQVEVALAAGAEVFAASGGAPWAVVSRTGTYHAEHVGDGVVNLVDVPGLAPDSRRSRDLRVRVPEIGPLPTELRDREDLAMTIGEGVTRPERISGDNPVLAGPLEPDEDGVAFVRFVVGTDGRARHIDIVQHVKAADASIEAVLPTWRFKPALYAGKPVAVRFAVRFAFKVQ